MSKNCHDSWSTDQGSSSTAPFRHPYQIAIGRVVVGAEERLALLVVVALLGRPGRQHERPGVGAKVDEHRVLARPDPYAADHQRDLGLEYRRVVRAGAPHLGAVVEELDEVVGVEDLATTLQRPAVADLDPVTVHPTGAGIPDATDLGRRAPRRTERSLGPPTLSAEVRRRSEEPGQQENLNARLHGLEEASKDVRTY